MVSNAIDVCLNLYTPEIAETQPAWRAEFIREKIGNDTFDQEKGLSLKAHLEMMDRAGIQQALVPAIRCGPYGLPTSNRIDYELVAQAVSDSGGRLHGMAGIDPTEGMHGVRQLEHAVSELGFVGAHLYPHWFDLPPDDRRYYPFYAKCVELDIPVQMQVGHCLRYSSERPLRSVGRPITLDTVACDFPELKLVGIHIGWPWTEEMIAVAYKHPNVYIGSDAYAPKYWKKEFVDYIDSWGSSKVLFGTDFPVIDPVRATREIAELQIRDISMKAFMTDNTAKLYGLEAARPAGTGS